MAEKKPYPVQHVVNWYFGNFCTRKCFDKDERLKNCWDKLQEFAKKNNGMMIRHKEFKDLFDNDDMRICLLCREFGRKTVGWKQFERWKDDSEFDPDRL